MQTDEEYIQTIASVEDMEPIAKDIVKQYCIENGIEERDIFPSMWDDIIDELYIKLFKPCNRLLKTESNLYNQYDKDKVIYVYQYIYKRLCNNHCQEISQKGFLDMTGIDKQTLYNWKDSSSSSFDLQEKIMEDNEQSLFSLMKDRRNNPMKILPKLNRKHGWNMPGVKEQRQAQQLASREELGLEAPKERPALPGTGGND